MEAEWFVYVIYKDVTTKSDALFPEGKMTKNRKHKRINGQRVLWLDFWAQKKSFVCSHLQKRVVETSVPDKSLAGSHSGVTGFDVLVKKKMMATSDMNERHTDFI